MLVRWHRLLRLSEADAQLSSSRTGCLCRIPAAPKATHSACSDPAEQDRATLDLLVILLPAMQTYNFAATESLWPLAAAACSQCLPCILGFHDVHSALNNQDYAVADGMLVSRAEYLEGALEAAQAAAEGEVAKGHTPQLGAAAVLALFEVLLFHRLLRDKGAHQAMHACTLRKQACLAAAGIPCMAVVKGGSRTASDAVSRAHILSTSVTQFVRIRVLGACCSCHGEDCGVPGINAFP